MRRFFFTILFTAAIGAAHAAEAPVPKPAGLPATNLTLNDCLLILQGLQAIDEHIVVVGKEPNQQLVKQSYEYGPGGFRLNVLAHNIRVLTDLQQTAQAEQQKILRDILQKMPAKDGKPATEIPAGTEEAIEYDRKLKELTSAPCLADLTHFKEQDLKLDKNELPAAALANLEKIRDK
jgi:hypothetical protein